MTVGELEAGGRYVRAGGAECIVCHGRDIDCDSYEETVETAGCEVARLVGCSDCGARWAEVFVLARVEALELGWIGLNGERVGGLGRETLVKEARRETLEDARWRALGLEERWTCPGPGCGEVHPLSVAYCSCGHQERVGS